MYEYVPLYIRINALQHCNTLQHTATQRNTLHSMRPPSALLESHCIYEYVSLYTNECIVTLQHTATHCNTLQHTATRCTPRDPQVHS